MAGATTRISGGLTVAFGTSAFSQNLLSYTMSGRSIGAIETTHQGTTVATSNEVGGKTYAAEYFGDPGTLVLNMHYDPDKVPPMNGVAETITITYRTESGDSTGTILSVSGLLVDDSVDYGEDGIVTWSGTWQCSGVWTRTVAS